MKQVKILSATLFQRELTDNSFLGMGLVELDSSVKEKMFYIFDQDNLSLVETDIQLNPYENNEYKKLCISGMFTSIDFLDFPEYKRFKSSLLIPVKDNIYFILTVSKDSTIFSNDKGDNFYTIKNNFISSVEKNIKTIGDALISISRKPIWSAGQLENISFQGFNTESFYYYKKSQKAFNDFINGKITEQEFSIINNDNFYLISGYNDKHYLECIKNILQKDNGFLINHSFYFSYSEHKKRNQLFKTSLEETMN